MKEYLGPLLPAAKAIKTNRGIAIRVWLVTKPNNRPAVKLRSDGLNPPSKTPASANIKATPASVKATE